MSRICVKDLKKFLEDKPEDSEVYVETYDGNHHKEFLYIRDYKDASKPVDYEIQVAKEDLHDER